MGITSGFLKKFEAKSLPEDCTLLTLRKPLVCVCVCMYTHIYAYKYIYMSKVYGNINVLMLILSIISVR